MSKLKPIGSEKFKGQKQIDRILQIAKYKENLPNSLNESSRTDYSTKLVDGNVYSIVKEKLGYVIKKGINESSLDYVDSMKNRNYYNSYADALKKLNLVASELNRIHNINEGISLFTEDKKYFLKTPTPAPQEEETPPPPPPMAEPASTPTPPEMAPPSEGPEEPTDNMGNEMGPENPEGIEGDTDSEMPIEPEGSSDDDQVTFKTIQKLTGKLAQKIRDLQNAEEEISSKDAKYVVNSILSALSDNLEDDDKEDIITKLEGDEGDEGDEEMGMQDDTTTDEGDEEMGMQGDSMTDENQPKGEMGEGKNKFEVREKYLDSIMRGVFKESKVDSVLSKYFVVNENEKKFQQQKKQNKQLFLEQKRKSDKNQIARLSETVKQKKVATDVINSFPDMKFVGKTNKGNLVFEHNNKQLKVSPKGELL